MAGGKPGQLRAGAAGNPLSSGRCPEGASHNPDHTVSQDLCGSNRWRFRLADKQHRC